VSAFEVWTFTDGDPDWAFDSSHPARVSALARCLRVRRPGVLAAVRAVAS
jgi:hypothetical protein